ncbi:MAG TPA: hypothetical protein VG186_16495 [Solirubrobacteraceae bacterium]|nr:hypothetical protein [Solirubrobacteraceae bacterium]
MSAQGALRAAVAGTGTGIAMMTAAVALAAAPLPKKGTAYGKGTVGKQKLVLVLVTTVLSATKITGTLTASGICTASVHFSLPVTNLAV